MLITGSLLLLLLGFSLNFGIWYNLCKMRDFDKLGIIGYGNFGQFIHKHLEKHFEVFVFKRDTLMLETIKDLDYLVFCVPLNSLEDVCKKFQDFVTEKTILIDVTSVKVKPLEILEKYFVKSKFQILGTHPIFGPESGREGIENLPIVLTNVSVEEQKYLEIKNFLSRVLELKVIETTPVEHDKQMAVVQGLSHFIGRALKNMDIKEFETQTKSYKQLVNLKELLGGDSLELYKTIQEGNPYTKEVRERFLKELLDLEKSLV